MMPNDNMQEISSFDRFERIVRDYTLKFTLRRIDGCDLHRPDTSGVCLSPGEVEIDQNHVA